MNLEDRLLIIERRLERIEAAIKELTPKEYSTEEIQAMIDEDMKGLKDG